MRLFALKDANDPDDATLAVLACYGGPVREYYIDMPDGADPWAVPLILSSFAKRGQWAIGPAWSRKWVESRVVPPSRQNIGEVLKVNGLEAYDELALLETTEGRNSQDDCYLMRIQPEDAPTWFAEREKGRIAEAVALEGNRLLACFRRGGSRVLSANELLSLEPALERVFARDGAFERAEVAPGGRGVRWGAAVCVDDVSLREAGTPLPLSWEDMARIAPEILIDAAEAEQLLGCSRQNVHALAKRGTLTPVKTSGKATLFLRADVRAFLHRP